MDPSWPSPRIGVLAVRFLEGDAEGALASLRALPDEFRQVGEAELLLGRLLARKEEWSAALAALDRAVALLPGLAEAQALRGEAAYNAGELTLAADAYGRAVAREPGNLAYRSRHALLLGYDGRRQEAVAALVELTAKPRPDGRGVHGSRRDLPGLRAASRRGGGRGLRERAEAGPEERPGGDGHRPELPRRPPVGPRDRGLRARLGLVPPFDPEALLGTAWCYQLSGDDTRARFYTGLAARAGADVEPLRRALQREGATADDFERVELAEGLRSKNAGDQARAVKGLLELGRPAVASLAAALGRPGTSLAARERIVDGLGRLGPAARDALPQLDRLAAAPPPPAKPEEPDEEKALREREARLAESARAAAERIRGRRGEAP